MSLQLRGTGALVITAMLDFLTFALCAPYSETTDGSYFDSLLEMVANDGRAIFRLFQVFAHPLYVSTGNLSHSSASFNDYSQRRWFSDEGHH